MTVPGPQRQAQSLPHCTHFPKAGRDQADAPWGPHLLGPSRVVLAVWSLVPSRPVGPRGDESAVRDVALGSELTRLMQDPPAGS